MIEFVDWITLFGTGVFAVSGALMALRHGMDIVGVAFIATVTGIGGGTFRDILLGQAPIVWVSDPKSVFVCIVCATVCCFFNHSLRGRRLQWLLYADAAGLATFAVLGAQKAEIAGAHPLVMILLGALSASFGGIVRDVLCNEPPVLLRQEIYITAAILGALVYWAIPATADANLRLLSGGAAALALRFTAIRYGWSLNFPRPLFPEADSKIDRAG